MGCGSSKAAAAEPAVFSTTVEPFEAASSSGESFTHISEKKESRVKERSQNNSGEEVIDVVYSTEEEVLSTSAAQYQGAHRAEGGSFSSLGSLKGIAGTNKGSNRNGKSNIVFSPVGLQIR
eukprot:g9967.t1